MKQILLSVIVPVYNVENYLAQCIESLVAQLAEDVEIILVDDGSTDRSSEIAAEYCQRFENISCVKQKNGGLSAARNTGLSHAAGKYVWFVDSDDYVRGDAFAKIRKFVQTGSDVIRFGFHLFDDGSGNSLETHQFGTALNRTFEDYFASHEFLIQAWAGIYKRDFLQRENIRFEKGLIYEDVHFNLLVFSKKGEISVFPDVLYEYRARSGSLLRSNTTMGKVTSLEKIIGLCTGIIRAGGLSPSELHVKKKFDYLYLYAQHLKDFDALSPSEKLARFARTDRHVPVLASDGWGLRLQKVLLRYTPSVFFKNVRQ